MIKVLVCDDDRIITEKVQQLLTIVQEQYSFGEAGLFIQSTDRTRHQPQL